MALKCNSPGQTRLGDPRQDKELWVVQSKLDWEAARAPAPEGIKCGEGFASGSWEGGLRLPAPRFCQDLKPRLRGLGAFPGGTAPLGPSPGSHSTSGLAFPRLGDTLGDLSLSPLMLVSLWPNSWCGGCRACWGWGSARPHRPPRRGHVRLCGGLVSTSVRWHSDPFSASCCEDWKQVCVGPGPWHAGGPMGSRRVPGTGSGSKELGN